MNIQTPSAGGVSRNTYSQFDVGQNGVILNNSHKNTATQLGGMVAANPWLAKGEAKIILNEVNARDPSRLNGFIEVAGQKRTSLLPVPQALPATAADLSTPDEPRSPRVRRKCRTAR